MAPLADQPGEIGFCDLTKALRVEITLRGEPFPHLLAACGGGPKALRTLRLHHDRLIVLLGSAWACQLPRAYGNGGHGHYHRHHFPDQRWCDFWQQLLAGGDHDSAARLLTQRSGVGRWPTVVALVVALVVAVRVEGWRPGQFLYPLCEQAKASYELPALIQKLDRYGLLVTSNQPFREAVDCGRRETAGAPRPHRGRQGR
jgi:hypothetical protein